MTGLLKAETNDLVLYYFSLSKQKTVTNPWDFISIMVRTEIMGNGFKNKYSEVIKYAQDILYGRMEIVTRNLPDKNDRTY